MKTYRIAWAASCGPVIVAAITASLLVVPTPVFASAALIGATIGALTTLCATADEAPLDDGAFRCVVGRVVLVGTGAGVLVALGGLLEGLLIPCVAVFGVTSPPVARRLAGWLFQLPPHTMSDQQLCSAWRSTTRCLPHTAPDRRLPLVQQRQTYLDEMELRNGPGFQDWLDSGGGLDAALECFLVRDSSPGR